VREALLSLNTLGNSLFWQAVRNVATQVRLLATPYVPDDLSVTVGWSNLVKIGLVEGNPDFAVIRS